MARLVVEGDELVVALSWWERPAAHRRDVRVPVSAIRQVTVEPDWWRALRGMRGRGTWIPGVLSIGTRTYPGGTDFAAVRARGRRPVVCVDLEGPSPCARLAVTDPDPAATARAVRAAAGL
ncbi:hypothetical protein OG689_02650 [Kitasatospora sp. NBC_00240]|uniref:hypothetical protein n=1 Tax=Kitasatospora sp. NBC_00240 TaxID=2903567 RepID=UPI00224D359A|nr:hypothetical protein [Kitasatospora sp. NBC_00240]MCX5208216.1 hypothetical protein [Kitasatospora sp. NBC_00240]